MGLLDKFKTSQDLMARIQIMDGLAPLLIRIYLAPIFIQAGWGKLASVEDTAAYFGNANWGLGLPFPDILAVLAGGAEFIGGWFLLFGFLTRLIAIPLMVTMLVAALTAHWQYGWHALPETTLTVPWEWRMDLIEGAVERKEAAKNVLQQYGDYAWLTEHGNITILKNGVEFTATYFIMLLVLFFSGGGRFTSLDYFVQKFVRQSS
ncbi:DoxX family protein [Aliiglaciecola sp. LCG003]|uniref:HvfX family Cu-binding RiPP maturation protein n=1 Tax=Aliiglaciecola sp. LCG003 TaxID=3053655 RepID=UPI0025736704|nr:DoxX family protein [Aliiglaciecola sp. LCG003]WJG11086.1 DoxX family protein [Aliiglaciecola sp. LCG003]